MSKIISGLMATALLMTAMTSQASAGLIAFTLKQVGDDVVMTASGSFNLEGLIVRSNLGEAGWGGDLDGTFARVGPGNGVQYRVQWLNNPSFFAPLAPSFTTIAFGDRAGFDTRNEFERIFLNSGSDGQDLFGTATFSNTTLADFGLSVGDSASFTYRDLVGNNGGVVTIAAIPEPSALLLAGSLIGIASLRRRRR
jgi:hypothetical protein